MAYIYILKCPITKNVKYVGRTACIDRRFIEHISEAKRIKNKNKKEAWIKSLLNKNLEPLIEVVEIVSNENIIERERFYINEYSKKFELLNSLAIGDGILYHTQETKDKIRKTKTGVPNLKRRGAIFSQQHRDKMSKAKKGIAHKIAIYNSAKKRIKAVQQFENGILINDFESTVSASKSTGVFATCITSCCKGKRKSAGNFIWKYT